MLKRFVVLGGGSAGLLAAVTLKTRLPDCEVRLIHSSKLGIIGVGEGTTPVLPEHLHGYLKIDRREFYPQAKPTWKLGVRFVWGPRKYFHYSFEPQLNFVYGGLSRSTGYYCDEAMDACNLSTALMEADCVFPVTRDGRLQFLPGVAYHLENAVFVEFLEQHALRLGVEFLDDTITQVDQDEQGITCLHTASQQAVTADLYLDCSGFRSLLLGDRLAEPFVSFRESLFCDRAIVGGWQRTTEPIKPYTLSETMQAGWSWQIEHRDRINRGYVYSSDFLSDEEAETELRTQNPQLDQTRIVNFHSGYYQRSWVKNVVAIGNAAGFVEPLEATALGEICTACHALADTIREGQHEIRPSLVKAFNLRHQRAWEIIRRFLALHYKFNTRLETPFWKACQADTNLAGAEPIVEYYQENGPGVFYHQLYLDPLDPFGIDGYLTMLVGMKVPHQGKFHASREELYHWKQIRQTLKARAEQGVGVSHGLSLVESIAWNWENIPTGRNRI